MSSTAKTGGDEDPQIEERAGIVREVGSQAVWSLSSCKPGIISREAGDIVQKGIKLN